MGLLEELTMALCCSFVHRSKCGGVLVPLVSLCNCGLLWSLKTGLGRSRPWAFNFLKVSLAMLSHWILNNSARTALRWRHFVGLRFYQSVFHQFYLLGFSWNKIFLENSHYFQQEWTSHGFNFLYNQCTSLGGRTGWLKNNDQPVSWLKNNNNNPTVSWPMFASIIQFASIIVVFWLEMKEENWSFSEGQM